MNRTFLIALAGVVVAGPWFVCFTCSRGAEIQPATDAPQPLPVEEALKHFQLPPGFRIEPVASEPYVTDPVAMVFDARGRIIVCELHGYNLEGYLDIVELNKTGVLDEAIKRVHASPELQKRAAEMSYGTVKLLEDTDGDGRVDRSTVLADKLPMCYGMVPARGGVIVVCWPKIIFLADRDGDGKTEVQETLFTGFGYSNLETRMNNPRWNIDNWIYVANRSNGGTIGGPNLPGSVWLGNTCFRLKPNGSVLEPSCGHGGGFGHAISDWGDRFLCTNQQHCLYVAPLPHRYLARNPYYSAPNPRVNICTYGSPARVYPTSQPHPWRTARSKKPEWMKFYGASEATANGYFTAASGQTIYRAAQFPPEYRGNHFSVDNAQNMVHRCLLEHDGVIYKAKRAPGEEQKEFLTSAHEWFRPVNLTTGPDGALYIVDMYREIIEDYSAIPRYLQQRYCEGIVAGSKRGRIWRVVADGASKPRKPNLDKASTAELVAELSNDNGWWRQTAQRLLVERGDKGAAAPLAVLVCKGKTPQTRLHALYTLDGLRSLQPAIVERALNDSHFAVRVHALRLAEQWLDNASALTRKVLQMVDDPDPKVQVQLALTLGESKDPGAAEALRKLAARHGDDGFIRAAIISSVPDSALRLLGAIRECADHAAGQSQRLVHPLASVVGARHDDSEIGTLLKMTADSLVENRTQFQTVCLKGLVEGLKRGKPQVLKSSVGLAALRRLLVSRSHEVQQLALRVAGLVRLQEVPEMKAMFAAASKIALDENRDLKSRQAALAMLCGAPYSLLASTVEELIDPRKPLDLQLAAVKALSATEAPEAGSVLLANWPSHTPKVQDAVIDAIFSRQNRLSALLDAIEENIVSPSSLDNLRRLQLIENPDSKIRGRAKSLLASQGGEKGRGEIITRYQAALAGAGDAKHDAKRGEVVYEKHCAKCHKLNGQGYEVGPDLSAVNNRADETLVSDILDPNNQITVGFRNYTIITEDGRIFTGVLAAETATSVTLRREEGVEETILRKNIDEMAQSPQSMMPEDINKEVSPRDVADLIAYLRETLGPASPSRVTLFEDDRSFAESLNKGSGTATIRTDDRFSGTASLAVTPLQRYSLWMPGWKYRIVEKPSPGEFRYIRFAWKTKGGDGALIELIDNGKWPPAEKPLRRYYAGKNTTGWAAVEISPQAPKEWIVVTRDLWKDFGEFTLTGIAPTAIGGEAFFDRIELLRSLDDLKR